VKPRTLIKNHETKYIKAQGNLPRHIDGYEIRGTSGAVTRKRTTMDFQDDTNYLVLPGFNSREEHAWNGASEL